MPQEQDFLTPRPVIHMPGEYAQHEHLALEQEIREEGQRHYTTSLPFFLYKKPKHNQPETNHNIIRQAKTEGIVTV